MADRRRATRYGLHAPGEGALRVFEDVMLESLDADAAVVSAPAPAPRHARVFLQLPAPGAGPSVREAIVVSSTPFGHDANVRFRLELKLLPSAAPGDEGEAA